MNGKKHLLFGGAIGGSEYVLYRVAEKKPINMLELILYSIVGAITGIFPDILEPATNPNDLKCEQVIIGSHESELEGFVDNIFRVIKESGESKILTA